MKRDPGDGNGRGDGERVAAGRERAIKLVRVAPPAAERLHPWVERMRGVRAVVWGDFVLDEYWRCLTRRVSREAPVLVLDWRR